MIYLNKNEVTFKLIVLTDILGETTISFINNESLALSTINADITTNENVANVVLDTPLETGIYTYKLNEYTGLIQVGNYQPETIQYNNNITNKVYNG